jgi:hypothetical protein
LSRKLLAVVLALVLTGWLLLGCRASGGKMTPATASTLQRDVAAVVSAADGSRWDAAVDALDQLETDVASAQATGGLSDERAAQIRAVRQRVLEDLLRIRRSGPSPGPATTTQTTRQLRLITTAATAAGTTARAASQRTMETATMAAVSIRVRTRIGKGEPRTAAGLRDPVRFASSLHCHSPRRTPPPWMRDAQPGAPTVIADRDASRFLMSTPGKSIRLEPKPR